MAREWEKKSIMFFFVNLWFFFAIAVASLLCPLLCHSIFINSTIQKGSFWTAQRNMSWGSKYTHRFIMVTARLKDVMDRNCLSGSFIIICYNSVELILFLWFSRGLSQKNFISAERNGANRQSVDPDCYHWINVIIHWRILRSHTSSIYWKCWISKLFGWNSLWQWTARSAFLAPIEFYN